MTAAGATRTRRSFAHDKRGAAAMEFAIVAPVLCLLLAGGFDVAHTLYMRAVLQGVVQNTARNSSLETGTLAAQRAALDAKVTTQAQQLVNNATVTITRRFYRTFTSAAAAQAEAFTDTSGNGVCDLGEPYEDANGNGIWDADGGDAGQGGAKDAVLYTVQVSYPHLFPLFKMVGGSTSESVSASTVLKNQPYGDQAAYGPMVVRNCP